MSFTVVQTTPLAQTTSTTASTITVTFGGATTAGNTIIICFGSAQTTENPTIFKILTGGIKDNIQPAIRRNGNNPPIHYNAEMWFNPNCTGGQTTYVISFSRGKGATAVQNAVAYEIQGILAVDRNKSSIGSSGTYSSKPTALTTNANEIWFGCASVKNVPTAVGAWTVLQNTATAADFIAGRQTVTATGPAHFSGTATSGLYTAVVATFYASSSSLPIAIPAIPDMAAGSIATADQMNALAYGCTFLMNKPFVRVHDSAGGQSIGTGNTYVSFGAKDFDTNGMWSAGAPTLLTVNTAGWYKIRYAVVVASGSVINAAAYSISGANNPQGAGVTSAAHWGSSCTGAITTIGAAQGGGIWPFYLYQGDQLKVGALASSAAPLDITIVASYFCAEYVSI